MSEFEKTSVIELVPISKIEKKRSKPVLRSAAVIIGSLTLTAGFAKAMGTSDNEPKLAIATADSLPGTTDTTILQDTTTTVILDTTIPVDTTINLETTIPLVQDPDTTTTNPDTTTTTNSPTDPTSPSDTTLPPQTTSPATTIYQQDIYREMCLTQEWVNCAEYNIYDEYGEFQNRVIANSDWTLQYIAENSGGGVNGTAVKIRDIYPL